MDRCHEGPKGAKGESDVLVAPLTQVASTREPPTWENGPVTAREYHLVPQYALFAAQLVPVLGGAGARVLASESARREEDEALRGVVRGENPDRATAIDVLRSDEQPGFVHVARDACVDVGYAHLVLGHGQRLGTALYENFGDRIAQVALHHNMTPAPKKRIEQAIERVAQPALPIGNPIAGRPVAAARGPGVMPFRLLPDATLADLAQSLVVLAPVDKLRRTAWIWDFVAPDRFANARLVADRILFVDPCVKSLKELDDLLPKRFAGQVTVR